MWHTGAGRMAQTPCPQERSFRGIPHIRGLPGGAGNRLLRPGYRQRQTSRRAWKHTPQHAGVCALLVHTLSEDAKIFYVQNGFLESPLDPMTLVLSLKDAAHNL